MRATYSNPREHNPIICATHAAQLERNLGIRYTYVGGTPNCATDAYQLGILAPPMSNTGIHYAWIDGIPCRASDAYPRHIRAPDEKLGKCRVPGCGHYAALSEGGFPYETICLIHGYCQIRGPSDGIFASCK